mgnify:CR=1 FL=1
MAQAFNPNPLSVNGMGVPTAARPVPTEEQALRDTLDVLRNSLRMMEGDDLAAEYAEAMRQVRTVERRLSGIQVAANLKACGASAITPQSFAAWAEVQFADLVDAEREAYEAEQDAGYVAAFGIPEERYTTDQGVLSTLSFADADTLAEIEVAYLNDVIPAGRCPVCGSDLTEHPHSEAQCAEWFAEDYRDADETRADLWQF